MHVEATRKKSLGKKHEGVVACALRDQLDGAWKHGGGLRDCVDGNGTSKGDLLTDSLVTENRYGGCQTS